MRPADSAVPDLVPIEELDKNILNLCTRINAATFELLTMIREFDERVGWLKWGSQSCAEWLAWRCDLTMATAREKVRVAHAIKGLAVTSAAFSTGELSYSKVRELTRVATPANEEELVAFALRNTTSFVAERCRELRMGDVSSVSVAERAFANRNLRLRRNSERGVISMTVDLPIEVGELIDKALDKARDDAVLELADVVDTSWSKRQADAFVAMLRDYLNGEKSQRGSTPDNHLVMIHVDESALAGEAGRSSVPIETARRLCCDGSTVTMVESSEGEPLAIGRKSRTVPAGLERAVRARDKNRCTFPGCHHHRFLDCHHVKHWSNGGETSLENLLLLCTKHHTLVHEGGFRIEKDFTDSWVFKRPDGTAVPTVGYYSNDMLDEDCGENSNPPRGGLLGALEKVVNEPPPPTYRH